MTTLYPQRLREGLPSPIRKGVAQYPGYCRNHTRLYSTSSIRLQRHSWPSYEGQSQSLNKEAYAPPTPAPLPALETACIYVSVKGRQKRATLGAVSASFPPHAADDIGAVLLQSVVACKLCLIRPGVSLGVRLGVPPVSPRLSGNASARRVASIPCTADTSSATTPKV
jgi:hypothetical protein